AILWDVSTGKELDSWKLNPGLNDHLAFRAQGTKRKLLLVRTETERGELPPLSNVPSQEHPRVIRAYNLDSPGRRTTLSELTEFPLHAWAWAIAPDASYFVVEGKLENDYPARHVIRILDGTNGKKELASFHAKVTYHSHAYPDPTGHLLSLCIYH